MVQGEFRAFALKFGAYFILGHFFFLIPPVSRALVEPWTAANARWAAAMANQIESGYAADGQSVQAGTARLSVELGCNGVDAFCLCASAILAFPASWSRRAIGIGLAMFGVFGLNLVRLSNLYLIARHFPARLELFHVYIWQTLIGVLSLGLFLLWGRYLARPATASRSPVSP
ncbi:MAG TPA: exosortase H [Candidatus Polarisedimenticolia bacterium]|nr:exosortase H [Candidatus Polarisedimenticolia bacterium]